jgi:hypothetical protein
MGTGGPVDPLGDIVFDPHVSQAIGFLLMALIPAFARTAAVALALGSGRRR